MCRVYGFVDEQSKALDLVTKERFDPRRGQYIFVSEWRYRLRLETTSSVTAKAFFEAIQRGDVYDLLTEINIKPGEVIEIDDGLKPYCFYCMNWSRIIPIFSFNRSRVQKGE